MNNDIDHQEHEVVTTDTQFNQILNKQLVEVLGQLREKEEECSELIELIRCSINLIQVQLVEVLGQLREKEEECSELIELINHKNAHILELTQEIHHLKGTLA